MEKVFLCRAHFQRDDGEIIVFSCFDAMHTPSGLIFALKNLQECKRSHAKLNKSLEAARRLAFEACSEISIVLKVTFDQSGKLCFR